MIHHKYSPGRMLITRNGTPRPPPPSLSAPLHPFILLSLNPSTVPPSLYLPGSFSRSLSRCSPHRTHQRITCRVGRQNRLVSVVQRVSSFFLGPVNPSFRTPNGRLEFTVRRHNFKKDSLSSDRTHSVSPQPDAEYCQD